MRARSTTLAGLAALAALAAGCGEGGGSAGPEQAAAGRTLPLGTRAVSPFVDYGTSREAEPTKVGVRVLRVRRGRIRDLAPFDLTREQRKAVPYYVEAEFENLGGFAVSRNLLRASLEDRTGSEHRPATLALLGGDFAKCPETPRSPLPPGGRFRSCSPILLPEGVQPGRVLFQGDVAQDPLRWALRQ